MRIKYRPAALAKIGEQARDIVHRCPADPSAGGGKFVDRFPEWLWCRAHGPVLDIDDQKRRPLAEARRTPETGSAVGALLLRGDNAVPRARRCIFRHVCLLLHSITGLARVPFFFGDGTLAFFERGEA